MATIDFSNADENVVLNSTQVAIGSIISASSTEFVYVALDGTTQIRVTGNNLLFDANNIPTGGTVTTIAIDYSGDADNDVVISGFLSDPQITDLITDYSSTGYVNLNAQSRAVNSFFNTAFGEADTITAADGSNGVFNQNFVGDFHTVENGDTLVSAGDLFVINQPVPNLFPVVGDGYTVHGTATGGDDLFQFADGVQPAGSLIFDVQIVDGGVVTGGDDQLTAVNDLSINASIELSTFGDADIVRDGGQLTGGSDTISDTTGTRHTFYGDARIVEGASTLVGGNDTITTRAGSANNTIFFADTIYGDVQTIDGGSSFTGGNDIITTGAGNDVIYGDYANLVSGVVVSGGDDRIDAGANDDMIFGNEGNDWILGGQGGDMIDGGIGSDTASYETSTAGVIINLDTGFATGGDADGDTLTSLTTQDPVIAFIAEDHV
ncbi:MAG: hypothetical protein AAFN43_03375, partial [Pseudomonadota bacterium]